MHEASRNASWDRCWGRAGQLLANFFFTRPSPLHARTMQAKAWFSLAYKHKRKDIRTRRMANLTQFSIPALLNPMINKMADEAYCFSYVCMRSGSKWLMIGPRLCAYACAYVDPVFTSQSYDISISARRTYLPVFLVLILMLMSTQFSFALQMCLCLCLRAKENQA